MKKSRNGIALLLVMIIVQTLMPQAVLEAQAAEETTPAYTDACKDYFTGWSDWSGAQADNSLKYMCVTDEIAHSGDRCILIRHVGEQGNNQNICLAQSELTLEAGTYTISFWAVGTKTDSDIQGVTLADPWRKYSMQGLQAVETDGIWSKYELEVTMEGTETAMTFVTDGDTEGWYIDDISLVKKDTTNNRIKNGGFELTGNAVYTDKYEEYLAGWSRWDAITPDKVKTFSCVTDAIAHDGNNSVVIRHTDSANAWKAIVVAQEGLSLTGTYTLSFWAAGDYAANTNCITVNGEAWEDYYLNDFTVSQSEGPWKKYTIDITIPEGKTNDAITFASNGNTNGWYIDDISLIKQGTTENLVKNEGFEEMSQSAVETAQPAVETQYTSAYEEYFNGWTRWDALEPDGVLRFSCVTNDIAHSGSNSVLLRHADPENNYKAITIAQDGLSLTGAYTLSFWAIGTVTSGDSQCFTLNGDEWVKYSMDNRVPVETDEGWSRYEFEVTVPDGAVDIAIAFAVDGNTNGWYIDDVSLVKSGTTENILKNGGFEEASSDAPKGDIVKEVVLKKDGQRVQSLDGQGNYSVSLVLNNYAIDADLSVDQIVAIYDEDGVLYDTVKSTALTVKKADCNGAFTTINTSFTLPEGIFTVEYFVFDGRDTLNIIGDPNPHRVFE